MKRFTPSTSIEPLELRVAPATLTGQVLTYTDVDGDRVAITFSKGSLTPGMFLFDTGSVNGDNSAPQQLQVINLSGAPTADGTNITMKVSKVASGDGLAAVGAITAVGRSLGVINLKGDLGDLEVSTSDPNVPAIKSITMRTIGAYGLATQGGIGNLQWNITGDVGSFKVAGDFKDVHVAIFGKLGPLTIGGSMIGGEGTFSGSLGTIGGIGPVKIGKDVRGGTGFGSGLLSTGQTIASITIGGSLIGGSGVESGELRSEGDMGPVKIAGDIVGGTGNLSGKIDVFGNLVSLTVGGSVIGGAGSQFSTVNSIVHEGQIFAVGNIGPVKIKGDMVGAAGGASGQVRSHGTLASLTMGGSLIGSGFASGQIAAEGTMGPIKIKGSIVGGVDAFSGIIHGYVTVASIAVGQSIVGSDFGIGGYVSGDTGIGPVTVGGSLLGVGASSGSIFSGGTLGAVKVKGNVLGGLDGSSGLIQATGTISSVTIGGTFAGAGASFSGAIQSFGGSIGPIKIMRNLVGGSITGTTGTVNGSGYIEAFDRIASLFVGGSVISGVDNSTGGSLTNNASARAGDDIGSITVKGSLIGNAGVNGKTSVIFSARGVQSPTSTSDLAIGKITIGGRVEHTKFLAGYTPTTALNGNAQIGAVRVGGDWLASDLVAGVIDTDLDGFGDADDAIIGGGPSISKIASIVIKGTVSGTGVTGDRFGFTSHTVGSFKSLGFTARFEGGADIIELSLITDDVTIRER